MEENEARWVTDPLGVHDLRYWDGVKWTGHVSDSGTVSFDSDGLSRAPEILHHLKGVRYLGSHSKVAYEVPKLEIVILVPGIRLMLRGEILTDMAWESIASVDVADYEALQTRVTATRLLTLGVFALFAPKKTTFSYLILEDGNGLWIFEVPGKTLIELQSLSRSVGHLATLPVPGSDASLPAAAPALHDQTTSERLQRLDEMLADSVIDDVEHRNQRERILNEL